MNATGARTGVSRARLARRLTGSFALLLFLGSCSLFYTGPADVIVETRNDAEETVRVRGYELNGAAKDVYFVFTNPRSQTASDAPDVSLRSGQTVAGAAPAPISSILSQSRSGSVFGTGPVSDPAGGLIPIRGRNESAAETMRLQAQRTAQIAPEPQTGRLGSTRGDNDYDPAHVGSAEWTVNTFDFIDNSLQTVERPSGLVGIADEVQTEFGPKTLEVWADDEFWENSPAFWAVNGGATRREAIVDAVLESFLLSGDGNDIYDLITGIYGEEWGDHDYANLISETDRITVYLYDIDEDYSPSLSGPVVLGYFYSLNNFDPDQADPENPFDTTVDSNGELIFYLDAPLFALEDTADTDDEWEPSDYWPREMISTLAHEFQHMIHFYQRDVLRLAPSESSDVWLNEGLSMLAEDFASSELLASYGVTGPRGVLESTDNAGAPGSPPIVEGRLPRFNAYPTRRTDSFDQIGPEVLESYATAYAFTAWLARTYGGAALVREIMQQPYGDETAVVRALEALELLPISGTPEQIFGHLIGEWGVSVITSQIQPAGDVPSLNNSGFFESTVDGTIYSLGSINHFNYVQADSGGADVGPFLVGVHGPSLTASQPAFSNQFYYAGRLAAGDSATWGITLPVDGKSETELQMSLVVIAVGD